MKKPVLFIFFRKMETTRVVFEEIKKYQPDRLYLAADGPRTEEEKIYTDELRKWVDDNIDWDCQVYKLYADKNMGCKMRVSTAISAAFEMEEQLIILEDDTKPLAGFFDFMEQALEMFKDDERVYMITGSNYLARKHYEIIGDYTFSRDTQIWGWGTYKRVWDKYQVEILDLETSRDSGNLRLAFDNLYDYRKKLNEYTQVYLGHNNTWDYQFDYMFRMNNGLCVVPKSNHVQNLGFDPAISTHTESAPPFILEVYEEAELSVGTLVEPKYVMCDRRYDLQLTRVRLRDDTKASLISRRILKLLCWNIYFATEKLMIFGE